MRIVIAGCGPAGGYIGYLLAQQGHTVTILEEHDIIGAPIQCTGILTKDILDLLPGLLQSDAVVNTIDTVVVHAPDNQKMTVCSTEYIVCRTKFDSYIAKLAQNAGANVLLGHKFEGFEDGKIIAKKSTNEKVYLRADILIGADGPRSKVAARFFPKNNIPCYAGMQTVVTKNASQVKLHTYDAYLGSDYPKFFGWDVPESPTKTRLGLAVKNPPHSPSKYYQKFCDKLSVSPDMIGERQGGQIPVFNPKNKWHARENDVDVFLLGDAATQIKSTTGGGIIPHLKCGVLLASCIKRKKYFRYRYSLRNKVSRELLMHLVVRKVLDTFSDKDYNRLVKLCNKKRVARVLQQTSRDSAMRLVPRLLFAQPRLLYFVKNMFFAFPNVLK